LSDHSECDAPAQRDLYNKLLQCVDNATAELNVTPIDIVGALEFVKARVIESFGDDEDDDE